jgi:hypothetical protein
LIIGAMLAGCGGSQPPIGAPGAMPQTSAIAAHSERGKSWMLPGTSSGALIYATGGCGGTCVLTYPSGTFVGALPTGGASICSDQAGNVFIPADDTVTEYAHGGESPIANLTLPGDLAAGCAVDPVTNNLAVVFKGTGADVAIFANETGTPTLYGTGLDSLYCGYDGSGNLFVDGYAQTDYGLAELPKSSNSFTILSIPQVVGIPGQVQWDGSHITYEGRDPGDAQISSLSVSASTVSIVGTTKLKRARKRASQSWLYDGTALAPYNIVGSRTNVIGLWSYPKGGKPKHNIRQFGSFKKRTIDFQAVTVSVKPLRSRIWDRS